MEQQFQFKSNYTDTETIEKLYVLFEKVFGVDTQTFRDFYNRGFWNPTYCPFTFFDGSRAIANTSMFSLDMVINQEFKKVAGIQSIMTHPDYRRKGLMRELLNRMLKEIDRDYETALLMTSSPELYTPFGFRVLAEHYFVTSFEHQLKSSSGIRKLNFFDEHDLEIIKRIFAQKTALSRHFMPVSYFSSFALNMYSSSYQEKLYLLEDIGVMIVFEVEEHTLKLYGVIGIELPALDEICNRIPYSFEKIEIHFCPDRFSDFSFEPVSIESKEKLMVRGSFPIEGSHFRFPITANF